MSIGSLLVERARAIPDYEVPVAGTVALAEAAQNYEANRIALEAACPAAFLALPDALPEMEWCYARDGALTARHVDRRWFADCSVPRRAADRLLGKFELANTSAIMLAPTHAQQIACALAKSTDRQALVVVLPGEYDAGVILACENFSAPIRAGRLLLVIGPDWNRQLDELLIAQEGIAPATTMIRVPGMNESIVERMLKPCDTILTRHGQLHKQHLTLIHGKPRPAKPIERVAIVAGGWRLWRDERSLLSEATSTLACTRIDTSRPDQSSALSIARRAESSDVIVMANLVRSNLPLLVAPSVPWVTLLTTGRPGAPSELNGRDRLVLVDESQRAGALAAGWANHRIDVLTRVVVAPRPAGQRPTLAIDLRPVVKPTAIAEMSSHGVVWDRVVSRLSKLDHVERKTPLAMIAEVAESVGVPAGDVPGDVVWELAAVPTFAVALARRLQQMHVAFDLFGTGWDAFPDLLDCWRGPIADEPSFGAMRDNASGLFNVWPGSASHASRRAGLPLIETWGRSDAEIAKAIQAAPKTSATIARFDLDAILARL